MTTPETVYSDALDRYRANSGYLAADSVAQAQAFVQACLDLLPFASSTSHGGSESVQLDQQSILAAKRDAEAWIASNSTAAVGVSHLDLSEFRRY